MRRTIEMAIAYSDGTWQAEHFVKVDDPGECCDSPGCCEAQDESERLEKLGREALQDQWEAESVRRKQAGIVGPEIVSRWLYHYMQLEDEVEDEPVRCQVACILGFDMGEVTEGSEIEQQAAAVELVNLSLQREPHGLGASLEKTT